jgi:hypothetical protein
MLASLRMCVCVWEGLHGGREPKAYAVGEQALTSTSNCLLKDVLANFLLISAVIFSVIYLESISDIYVESHCLISI